MWESLDGGSENQRLSLHNMPKIIDPPLSTTSSSTAPSEPTGLNTNRSLVDIRRVLFARKYFIVVVAAITIIISIIYAQTRVPIYEATATAEIDLSRSESMGLSAAVASAYSDDPTIAIQTQVFRLSGNSLIYRAVAELAAEKRGPFPDAFKDPSSLTDEDSLPPWNGSRSSDPWPNLSQSPLFRKRTM